MKTKDDLQDTLRRIDGRGYKAYKDITGAYSFDAFELHIDHVQADPFAAPSKLRVRVAQSTAAFPSDLFENRARRVGLCDYLARRVRDAVREQVPDGRGPVGGRILIDAGGQEVIERTAVVINREFVEARIKVGLPAAGRRVLGREAISILCRRLPEVVGRSLLWSATPERAARRFVDCVENHAALQNALEEHNLVAFVADWALLPRASGVTQAPMSRDHVVAFKSPDALQVRLALTRPIEAEDGSFITHLDGMGIRPGVTLIVGGGYHGKSTLLRALERGVYPHVPGDGREYVVTLPSAVKIRAEDGRCVVDVDISPFINDLPFGRTTRRFATEDASGSTSQAANIVEAIEAGTGLLLLDEDTCATNLMIRDARMQALVRRQDEPITPLVDRVREIYERWGVSTVLVMGGCGDYFDVADSVVAMKEYLPADVTQTARQIAREHPTDRKPEVARPLSPARRRTPKPESFDPSKGRREVKIDARGIEEIVFGRHTIDLRRVEQVVDSSQLRAVGFALHVISTQPGMRGRPIPELLDTLEKYLDEFGLDRLNPTARGGRHPGDLARPRRFEIAAAVNRMRTLKIARGDD